jgi:hypothetical protein
VPLFRAPDNAEPLLQGDIWLGLPFLLARRLPLIILRRHNDAPGGRQTYHGFVDGGEPQPTKEPAHIGFETGGDDVIAIGFRCAGIVLSHDCEIENAPDHVIVAPLLPWDNLLPEHQEEAAAGLRRDVFPILPQEQPPIEKSYAKFARLTVIHRDVFDDLIRPASAEPELRRRLAIAFFNYLLHPEDT